MKPLNCDNCKEPYHWSKLRKITIPTGSGFKDFIFCIHCSQPQVINAWRRNNA